MRFFAAAAVVAALPAAISALGITYPSPQGYWVAFQNNTIKWTYSSGDPSNISVYLWNADVDTLNGNFSISNGVDVSSESLLVSDVNIKVGDGYYVSFANQSNPAQVFATSQAFSVKPNGTAPSNTSTSSSSSSSSGSASGSGSATSGGASAATSTNAALRSVGGMNAQGVFGVIAACGIASLSALLL